MQAQTHAGNVPHYKHTRCLPRVSKTKFVHAAATLQSAPTDQSPLESACSTNRAQIGYNPQGYRGLLASEHVKPGETVISVPLHNILQVPRKLGSAHAAAAAQEALAHWQHRHGALPRELVRLIMNADCPWEAKLVSWLLHLKATAVPGSLWYTYCQALPSQQETLSFFCYSEQQAEQLQFSTWKALAVAQRQLLHDVQQQCQSLISNSSGNDGNCMSSAGVATQQDITWALSMVKSRTFGRALQTKASTDHQSAATLAERKPAADLQGNQQVENRFEELGSLPGAGDGGDGQDDSDVVLLMVPFVDMINHAQQNNSSFGLNWQSGCFEITSNTNIPQGEEITISYGSNKSNLALLSCYGFFIPANYNDAQLLQPIFRTCLAVAGGIDGFDSSIVETAVAELMQEGLAVHGEDHIDHTSQAARVECAAAALPVQQQAAALAADDRSQQQPQLHLQRYLAELIIYQVDQMLKLCDTSVDQDAQLLQGFATVDSTSFDQGVERQAVAARMEKKLLLMNCRSLCLLIVRSVTAAKG